MKTYYNDNYVASKYAFDTTRKAQAIAESLVSNPIQGLDLADPNADFFSEGKLSKSGFQDVARSLAYLLHSDEYFNAVSTGNPRSLAESQGFDWDPGIFTMALEHTSGLLAATYEALSNMRLLEFNVITQRIPKVCIIINTFGARTKGKISRISNSANSKFCCRENTNYGYLNSLLIYRCKPKAR